MPPPLRLPEGGSTRKFLPHDLPEAESPTQRLDLNGHPSDEHVYCVAVLPGSGNIATACADGHVRVFDLRGDGNPLLDIPAHSKPVWALAALDECVLASGAFGDGKLCTWDSRTGDRIHNIDLGTYGVGAIATVGPEALVAGLRFGSLVFVQHTRGRHLAEVARDEGAHLSWIQDIARHKDMMVTASDDMTARVWNLKTRKPLAVLRGHQYPVQCAAVNSRYIATGSGDKTLRLYANRVDFPLIFVLEGLHTDWIETVRFIGSDLILSGSQEGTMCFTSVSQDPRPIARLDNTRSVRDTAITADGQIACVGYPGVASVFEPPLVRPHIRQLLSALYIPAPFAVVNAAREHALDTFGSGSSTVLQLESLLPLQGAFRHANPRGASHKGR